MFYTSVPNFTNSRSPASQQQVAAWCHVDFQVQRHAHSTDFVQILHRYTTDGYATTATFFFKTLHYSILDSISCGVLSYRPSSLCRRRIDRHCYASTHLNDLVEIDMTSRGKLLLWRGRTKIREIWYTSVEHVGLHLYQVWTKSANCSARIWQKCQGGPLFLAHRVFSRKRYKTWLTKQTLLPNQKSNN